MFGVLGVYNFGMDLSISYWEKLIKNEIWLMSADLVKWYYKSYIYPGELKKATVVKKKLGLRIK